VARNTARLHLGPGQPGATPSRRCVCRPTVGITHPAWRWVRYTRQYPQYRQSKHYYRGAVVAHSQPPPSTSAYTHLDRPAWRYPPALARLALCGFNTASDTDQTARVTCGPAHLATAPSDGGPQPQALAATVQRARAPRSPGGCWPQATAHVLCCAPGHAMAPQANGAAGPTPGPQGSAQGQGQARLLVAVLQRMWPMLCPPNTTQSNTTAVPTHFFCLEEAQGQPHYRPPSAHLGLSAGGSRPAFASALGRPLCRIPP
jgi:hypothetical protein